jgi:hypothetical protein
MHTWPKRVICEPAAHNPARRSGKTHGEGGFSHVLNVEQATGTTITVDPRIRWTPRGAREGRCTPTLWMSGLAPKWSGELNAGHELPLPADDPFAAPKVRHGSRCTLRRKRREDHLGVRCRCVGASDEPGEILRVDWGQAGGLGTEIDRVASTQRAKRCVPCTIQRTMSELCPTHMSQQHGTT